MSGSSSGAVLRCLSEHHALAQQVLATLLPAPPRDRDSTASTPNPTLQAMQLLIEKDKQLQQAVKQRNT